MLGVTVTVEEVVVVTTERLVEDAAVDVPGALEAVGSAELVDELVEPLERLVTLDVLDDDPGAVELVTEPVVDGIVVEFP